MSNKSKIYSWLKDQNNATSSEFGILTQVKNPSITDILKIFEFLLDEPDELYLQFEDSPCSPSLCQNSSQVSEGLWNIHKGIDAKLMLDKWLYCGNWMVINSHGNKLESHSYTFKNISEFVSELMSNGDANAGAISFHDNSEIWVFSKH